MKKNSATKDDKKVLCEHCGGMGFVEAEPYKPKLKEVRPMDDDYQDKRQRCIAMFEAQIKSDPNHVAQIIGAVYDLAFTSGMTKAIADMRKEFAHWTKGLQ